MTPICGTRNAFSLTPSSMRAHEHARQQHALLVREDRADRDRARRLVDRDIAELQLAPLRVRLAVLENQRDLRRARAFRLDAPALDVLAQLQAVEARLREIDVDRIELLDGRHQRRLARLHVRARRDLRDADAARDRRDDIRIAEVDLRGLDGGLARAHVGGRLPLRGHRIVVLLLADRVRGDEHLVARDERVLRREVRLRLRERRLRAVQLRDIGCRIDLVQALAGLDVAAFGELAPQHDAVDPCAHLRDQIGARTARQFGDDRHGLRLDGDDADFGRLRGRSRFFFPHAARKTAAVATVIKRYGTRSTRMERPRL